MDISFILPCYNYSKYVCDAISSCINQSESKLSSEIIVVDDGSNDGSKEIIQSHFVDKIRFFSIENSGVELASNYGANRALGKYIVRVDADDMLEEDYLSNVENEICSSKDIIYTDYWEIDKNGENLSLVKLPAFEVEEILQRGDFLATGTAIKRSRFFELGKYDEAIKNSGLENYALILDALLEKLDFVHVPVPSFKYRLHEKSLSATKTKKIMENGNLLFARRCLNDYKFGKYHPWANRR